MVDDDKLPPRPVCEFEFNLPHGIDSDHDHEQAETQVANGRALSVPPEACRRDVARYSEGEGTVNEKTPTESLSLSSIQNEVTHTGRFIADNISKDTKRYDLQPTENHNSDKDFNYDILPRGFSNEDDDTDGGEEPWKIQKTTPKSKKLPRQSGIEDSSENPPPKPKKPRISLFGSGVDVSENDRTHKSNNTSELSNPPPTPSHAIRQQLLGMNLEEHEPDIENTLPATNEYQASEKGRRSLRSSPAPSDESVIIPPDPIPVYELRQNIDRGRPITHIDTDDTGNYDPEEEARKAMQDRQKARIMKMARRAQKKNRERKGKKEKVPERQLKCIVKLHFENYDAVIENEYIEDNWPKGHSEIDSDEEREKEEYRLYYRRNTPNVKPQFHVPDPAEELDDLTGHPAARGCRQCRAQKQECTMIRDGEYPCEDCEQSHYVCEPIVEALEKSGCAKCVEDGENCDPNFAICNYCADGDFACIPIPPRGYKVPRVSLDELLYGPNRKHAECTNCRAEKKKCSSRNRTDKPPCKRCKTQKIACTFYDIPKSISGNKNKGKGKRKVKGDIKQRLAPDVSQPDSSFFSPEDLEYLDSQYLSQDDDVVMREATPDEEMEDEAGNRGMLTKINTAFAHPIQFAIEAEQVSDCNFCEMPIFGFIGHFEREVHVIRWYDGRGFTDVGGGHCENNGSTTMCSDCTMSRLQVLCCPKHELVVAIGDDSPRDFDVLFDQLMSTEPGSPEMKVELSRWCSMCCSPAAWACGTVQPSVQGEEEGDVTGCGLRLCDRCAWSLSTHHGDDLETMAIEMDKEPKVKEPTDDSNDESMELFGKARADVGFLHRNGLLMLSVDSADTADDEDIDCV